MVSSRRHRLFAFKGCVLVSFLTGCAGFEPITTTVLETSKHARPDWANWARGQTNQMGNEIFVVVSKKGVNHIKLGLIQAEKAALGQAKYDLAGKGFDAADFSISDMYFEKVEDTEQISYQIFTLVRIDLHATR